MFSQNDNAIRLSKVFIHLKHECDRHLSRPAHEIQSDPIGTGIQRVHCIAHIRDPANLHQHRHRYRVRKVNQSDTSFTFFVALIFTLQTIKRLPFIVEQALRKACENTGKSASFA